MCSWRKGGSPGVSPCTLLLNSFVMERLLCGYCHHPLLMLGDTSETAETKLSAVSEVGKLGKDGFGQKCLGILCNLL
jgi:hypothetical protein